MLGFGPPAAQGRNPQSANSGLSETPDPQEDPFGEFLKEEYRNIASAHFNTGTTITQFFQFYLLIIGIPITGAGVLTKIGSQPLDMTALLNSPAAGIVAFAIAVAGLCMMGHLVNLRLEALHYARGACRFFCVSRAGYVSC